MRFISVCVIAFFAFQMRSTKVVLSFWNQRTVTVHIFFCCKLLVQYLTTCMLSGRRTAAGWPAHQPGGLQTRHVHNPCSIMTFKTLDQTTIIVDFYLGHMLTQPLPVLFRLGCWTSSWWLDEDNQLLLQTQKVDSLPSQLQLAMRGSGCTLVQTVLRYSYCYS